MAACTSFGRSDRTRISAAKFGPGAKAPGFFVFGDRAVSYVLGEIGQHRAGGPLRLGAGTNGGFDNSIAQGRLSAHGQVRPSGIPDAHERTPSANVAAQGGY
jgi:hypothetical protein